MAEQAVEVDRNVLGRIRLRERDRRAELKGSGVAPLSEGSEADAEGIQETLGVGARPGRRAADLGIAFEEARRTRRPVAVLMADEYHGFNR